MVPIKRTAPQSPFRRPQKTRYGMPISFLAGSSGKGPSLFLLFLQGIISKARSFSAGNLGRRRRSEENNSEITAYSGRLMVT